MAARIPIRRFIARLPRDGKELLYFTAVLVVASGLLRLFHYAASVWMLHICLIPYLLIRGGKHLLSAKSSWTEYDKHRFALLVTLAFVWLMNIFTAFKAEFLVLFLLMLDYLLVARVKK
ncbi:MAG: hypothetical protein LBT48_02215 [Prevotellaceae bacterium]|jgi:hypothetical protein|nr:hypothetical protein [Prevotellaceae bacterium]